MLRPEHLGLIQRASTELSGSWWTKVKLAGTGLPGWLAEEPGLYLDAVWLPAGPPALRDWSSDPDACTADLGSARGTVAVVARGYADRTVFGLLLAAQDLLALQCPTVGVVGGIALSDPGGHDANMDWVYHRHGFDVLEVGAPEVLA